MLAADGKEFIEKLERGNKAMTYHLFQFFRCTKLAKIFSVATEYCFEKGAKMKQKLLEFYLLLQSFYNQDQEERKRNVS